MVKIIFSMGLLFFSTLSFSSEYTCNWMDSECPPGYECEIRWIEGPYQCVALKNNSDKLTRIYKEESISPILNETINFSR